MEDHSAAYHRLLSARGDIETESEREPWKDFHQVSDMKKMTLVDYTGREVRRVAGKQ